MFTYLKRIGDRMFDRAANDTSVPVFDGALKPNHLLDTAEVFFEHPDVADMVVDHEGHLVVACGNQMFRLQSGSEGVSSHVIAQWPKPIQALSRFGDGLVGAMDDRLVFINGKYDGLEVSSLAGQPVHCTTALSEGPDGVLFITEGSRRTPYEQWATDLLGLGKTGRFLSFDPATGQSHVHAEKLAYGYGVSSDGSRALVSESWAHRVSVWQNGKLKPGVSQLPGYPSRISNAPDGGFWLTIFAPRSQLLEFVLCETEFRAEMMQTIDPKYWIAPTLSSGNDFLEPLQQGGVRQMGVLKPWAPARSYGLVLKLSPELVPLYSFHSRVGGLNHGIVSALEFNGSLLALSKGAGRILRVSLAEHQLQD